MSFDLGNILGSVVKAVLPMALEAVCPESALIPGLNNMVANLAGDMLSQGIDSLMQQSGSPQFMINDAVNLIKQAAQNLQQPCDSDAQDQVQNQFGGMVQNSVSDWISDILNKLRSECGGHKGHGGHGHGGNGGTGGTGGSSGPVTLRDLAAALGKLEEDEAARLKGKVDKASASLADTSQSSKTGTQTDSQFKDMEDVKAESQIQATLSSMVSEVIKNFGQALQSTGRA
jgi:hypothetical protein